MPRATIPASRSCRYLGVHMDTRLRWDYHREKMEATATKRFSALSQLASSTWGTGTLSLRYVDKTMLVSQMLYGCLAWSIPPTSAALVGVIKKIQRGTAQIITGAFRTTVGSAVDVEAHLLPVPQRLEQTALEATLCIRTTPLYDTMARQDPSSRTKQTLDKRSPLGRLSGILANHSHRLREL